MVLITGTFAELIENPAELEMGDVMREMPISEDIGLRNRLGNLDSENLTDYLKDMIGGGRTGIETRINIPENFNELLVTAIQKKSKSINIIFHWKNVLILDGRKTFILLRSLIICLKYKHL